jgi:hypothetical protein
MATLGCSDGGLASHHAGLSDAVDLEEEHDRVAVDRERIPRRQGTVPRMQGTLTNCHTG